MRLALATEPGSLATQLTALLGAHHDVEPWSSGHSLDAVDAAVDAVVVDSALKADVLANLDSLEAGIPVLTCCHAHSATLASAGLRHPERVFGFGLLPPLEGRATVECVAPADATADGISAATAVWAASGLEPVWVGDGAGLVLPRMIACLANEAAFTVMERTAGRADVDTAMELGTGYPRGPLEWAELIGLDHVVAIMDGLVREHGDDRYRVAPLLRRLAVVGSAAWPESAPDSPVGDAA